jgi:hypothetical protein
MVIWLVRALLLLLLLLLRKILPPWLLRLLTVHILNNRSWLRWNWG